MPQQIPTDVGPFVVSADGSARLPGALTVAGAVSSTGGVAAGTVSPRCVHTGNCPAMASTDGVDTTPSITETYVAECFVPCNMTVTGIGIFNGSAVGTDKLMAILYDATGAVVATTATAGTTAVNTDIYQAIPLTAPVSIVGPATYYVGLQCNGTTYRFNSLSRGLYGAGKITGTTFGVAAAITPPTTMVVNLGPIAQLY